MSLSPGARLGAYEVLGLIGTGGMGQVYRARDTKLGRNVALKVLPEEFAIDADRLARFRREAQVLASLNHPNIAAIYGLEESDPSTSSGQAVVRALVLELVEGPTLADVIAKRSAAESSGLPQGTAASRRRAATEHDSPEPERAQRASESGRGWGPGRANEGGAPCGLEIDEALAIAQQIADALEAAHELGIIHRDLKPANIKLKVRGAHFSGLVGPHPHAQGGSGLPPRTEDGRLEREISTADVADCTVKVLDFGLAKALGGEGWGEGANASQAPTITSPAMMTGAGIILGTAAYMSPEQARGKAVDKRADIWAFGCVLYEMLAGRRAFQGEDITETIAAVVKEQPDLTLVSSRVRRLLKSCLEKDPKKRLQAIGDMHLLLEDAAPTAAPSRPQLGRAAWAAAGAAALCAALLAFIHFRETPPDMPVIRSTILPPENTTFDFTQGVGLLALSPDGLQIVFGARTADGKTPLWVRSLAGLTAQPLAGTEGATFPFWSPDSRFIAFFADGKLKKIEASGGPVLTLTDALGGGRGGSWSRDGVIVFDILELSGPGVGFDSLLQVPSAGGASSPISTAQGSFPWFLPDGRHFLYQGQAREAGWAIRVGSLDGSPSQTVGTGSNALYAQGHLLFLREDTLMAQPFDTERLATTGEAVPVAEQVQSVLNTGRVGVFSVSEIGLLAYREGEGVSSRILTWFDRSGKRETVVGEAARQGWFEFSPDRTRVASVVQDRGSEDIWIYDVSRGLRTRFTFDAARDNFPVWSPDGRSIVFSSNRKGRFDLYRRAVDSVGTEELLYADDLDKTPTSWSADGKVLLYHSSGPSSKTGQDVWALPVMPERPGGAMKPFSVLQTAFTEGLAQFSPDGRWIAYDSNESQRFDVYVTPFPRPSSGPGGKRQISTAGASFSPRRWRQDGKEIFYVSSDGQLMAAEVAIKAGTLEVGAVRPLFPTNAVGRAAFDVSADGQRFLLLSASEQQSARPFTLIQNWASELKK